MPQIRVSCLNSGIEYPKKFCSSTYNADMGLGTAFDRHNETIGASHSFCKFSQIKIVNEIPFGFQLKRSFCIPAIP